MSALHNNSLHTGQVIVQDLLYNYVCTLQLSTTAFNRESGVSDK